MTTMRQWRLMIDGEDVGDLDGAQAMHGAEARVRAARRDLHGRPGGRVAWRRVVAWAVLAAGVLLEVSLSVVGLQFGFGWHVVILATLACLLLVIGSRVMQ